MDTPKKKPNKGGPRKPPLTVAQVNDQIRKTKAKVAQPLHLRMCLCGHVRGDHLPYTQHRSKAACLLDDCSCESFLYRSASAFLGRIGS